MTTNAPLPTGALDGDFEQLLVGRDGDRGLTALICVDSTVLGPADGGVRMRPYPTFADAVADVTRLARAMTLKYALAGVPRGGGKAVIVGDPGRHKTDGLLAAFGRLVDAAGGRYWAGVDSGLTLDDMLRIRASTPYVSTLPASAGGVGEIAPATAAGVVHAMRAAVERVWGTPTLAGRRVALQGVGACGAAAVDLLVAEGAAVVICDVDPGRAHAVAAMHDAGGRARAGVTVVDPDVIASVPADIFAPCALGGAIDETVADRLVRAGVRVVTGSANNVMADHAAEAHLVEAGVVYVPDLVANAGGCILDADRFHPGGHDPRRVHVALVAIGARTHEVLDRAARDRVLPSEAATSLARERLADASGLVGAGTHPPQATAAA